MDNVISVHFMCFLSCIMYFFLFFFAVILVNNFLPELQMSQFGAKNPAAWARPPGKLIILRQKSLLQPDTL